MTAPAAAPARHTTARSKTSRPAPAPKKGGRRERPQVYRPAVSERNPQPSVREAEKQAIFDSFHPQQFSRKNVDWVALGWITTMHLGAVAAPFFFSWTAVGVTVFLHWLTLSLGICLGYHRFLSHKSMKLRGPVDFFVTLCGVLSGEGTPLTWAATHRLHHQQSDQEGDPHSPLDGPWWSHIFWLFVKHTPADKDALFRRYVPELMNRKLLWMFERTYILWLVGSGVILFAAGELLGVGGLPLLLWGLCARMTYAYHSTWLVNSATHLWGYRNYETRDESRNLWWVALVSYGEGWHNNHHAHPSNARAGHKWYEIDPTFWVIKLLKITGLAYEVRDAIPQKS